MKSTSIIIAIAFVFISGRHASNYVNRGETNEYCTKAGISIEKKNTINLRAVLQIKQNTNDNKWEHIDVYSHMII